MTRTPWALATAGFALAGLLTAGAAAAAPSPRVAALIAGLTLDEKIAQLQSAAPAVPRLGLPAYDWWSEGLHGLARNGPATVFPQAIGLAAAWDDELMRRVGAVVSDEAREKFAVQGAGDHARYQGLTIWSPNVNIDRDPRWGRGQETYGEDPYMTGRLAVGFVQGLQGPDAEHPRVIATPKHFAVHSGPEGARHGFDVDVSPQDMEATYLPAFRAAVTHGHAGSVMCAYNALHGVPACASAGLLDQTLRRDWGFQGFVVSDCDAVDDMTKFHFYRADAASASAEALKAGTDLDCGFAYADLGLAVRRGEVGTEAIDRALTRLFTARERLGALGSPAPIPVAASSAPAARRTLALQAARESLVLLKNDHALLPFAAGLRLAVVGPDADALEALEANYHGTAVAPVTPLEGLRAALGRDHVTYAQGSALAESAPATVPSTALRPTGAAKVEGLTGAYYDNAEFSGAPKVVRIDRRIAFDWDHTPPAPGLDPRRYAVRWTGELVPPGPGDYTLVATVARCFDCAGHDRVRLFVDGALVFEDAGDGAHTEAKLHFATAAPHRLRFEIVHSGEDQGARLQWRAPADAQLQEARAAARSADAVVAVVGLSPDLEGEDLKVAVPGFDGGDRTDLALPAPQRRLLAALEATGKPVVVVLMGGGAVALGDEAAAAGAVLAAWYPGQAGGTAIARALIGIDDPGGRLPVTFYRSVKDLPAFADYRMLGRTYRYFTGEPLYPFGFGLSYTRFAYGEVSLSTPTLAAGGSAQAQVTVRNAGGRAGDEVVQAYLTPPPALGRPRIELVGFQRVSLAPGESREVRFTLDARALSSVDPAGRRAVEPGRYGLFLGGGQPGRALGASTELVIQSRQVLPK